MRPIDADALKVQGWKLNRSVFGKTTATYEMKDLDDVPTVDAVETDRRITTSVHSEKGDKMTLKGAIKQLHELQSAEDMPVYYKPIIAEVINVLLMDTKEIQHGRWIYKEYGYPTAIGFFMCSVCGHAEGLKIDNYCSECGARMDEEQT